MESVTPQELERVFDSLVEVQEAPGFCARCRRAAY